VLLVVVVKHVVEKVLILKLLEEGLNYFENALVELLDLHFVRAFLVLKLRRPHRFVGWSNGWPTHHDATL